MKKRILTAVLLFSSIILSGCNEKTSSGEQYYIVSDYDIQLSDDKPAEEYTDIVSRMKKNRDIFYLRIRPDKSLTVFTHRAGEEVHPDNDGYYTEGNNRFHLNNTHPDKPQIIFDKSKACILECVITMTLKQVAEDSNEIRLIKSKHTLITTVLTAAYLSQSDVFTQYPLQDFNGRRVNIGWPGISPHTLKLNFNDTLTEIQPDDNSRIKTYLSWFNLPYRPENIRAYHYTGSRYYNGVIMAVKDSDPVTDLKPVLRKMDATLFDEGRGAVFYSDATVLTGLYYDYDESARVLYLAVLPDTFRAVSEPFISDYRVIRTLKPDSTGIIIQESDLNADKETFEKELKSPLNNYLDKDRLTRAVTDKMNEAYVSPDFFFSSPKKTSEGDVQLDLSRLSGFFTENPVTLSATFHKDTVAGLLAKLKEKYPQGRIYQDVFINDNPPRFYFISETNTGLTVEYNIRNKAEQTLSRQEITSRNVIIAQLLRQTSPLNFHPVLPERIENFRRYTIAEDQITKGFEVVDKGRYINFEGKLIRGDTGDMLLHFPGKEHIIYYVYRGYIHARDNQAENPDEVLRLFDQKGVFYISGRIADMNQRGDAAITEQKGLQGVFDLQRREWLIKPGFYNISESGEFYVAGIDPDSRRELVFNRQGKYLAKGRVFRINGSPPQVMIFNDSIADLYVIDAQGKKPDIRPEIEAVILPKGTVYLFKHEKGIAVLNRQGRAIVSPYYYSKYKKGKTGVWLWSVRKNKWVRADKEKWADLVSD